MASPSQLGSAVVAPSVVDRLRAAGCVFAEDEAALLASAATSARALDAMLGRRVAGEPLEQVLGRVEFCGVQVLLERGVFVPRRRTALLARTAADTTMSGAVVVDLCCGSGAVGAAVACSVTGVELHAVDLDPVAVRCARRNVTPFGGVVHAGDLYAALPTDLHGRVDVVVANAPYVPTDAIALLPPEARLHEPVAALDGGPDGLDVVRRVVAEAGAWLAPGGTLLVESSDAQAAEIVAVFRAAGLTPRVVSDDDLNATVVVSGPGGS